MADPLIRHLDTERIRRGWSTQQWADLAGVHMSTVRKLVTGQQQGTVAVVRALAGALGLELSVQPKHKAAPDEPRRGSYAGGCCCPLGDETDPHDPGCPWEVA